MDLDLGTSVEVKNKDTPLKSFFVFLRRLRWGEKEISRES